MVRCILCCDFQMLCVTLGGVCVGRASAAAASRCGTCACAPRPTRTRWRSRRARTALPGTAQVAQGCKAHTLGCTILDPRARKCLTHPL